MEIRKNDLGQVEKHARALMTVHGVGHLEFHFDRGTRRIAALHAARIRSTTGIVQLPKKITMSKKWATVLPYSDLMEIMIHEIAHAYTVNESRPHGTAFRRKVVELGGTASDRCYSPSVNIDGTPRSK